MRYYYSEEEVEQAVGVTTYRNLGIREGEYLYSAGREFFSDPKEWGYCLTDDPPICFLGLITKISCEGEEVTYRSWTSTSFDTIKNE